MIKHAFKCVCQTCGEIYTTTRDISGSTVCGKEVEEKGTCNGELLLTWSGDMEFEDGKDQWAAGVETATTGAKRSSLYPPGTKFPARYDLMFRNAAGMRRLAETWGEGFAKYGADNWMKGFPASVMISHALEHIRLYLGGDKSEDHLAHGAWNLLALCWIEENKPELLDLSFPVQVCFQACQDPKPTQD